MPCFTATVSPGKNDKGDAVVNCVLNPPDLDKFREMYGGHALEMSVRLNSKTKELHYPVIVSSQSLSNSSSSLPHVHNVLGANSLVLSHTANSIFAIPSPRKSAKQSMIFSTGHGTASSIHLQRRHHCVPPRIKPLMKSRRRLISLLGLCSKTWA